MSMWGFYNFHSELVLSKQNIQPQIVYKEELSKVEALNILSKVEALNIFFDLWTDLLVEMITGTLF